MNVDFGHQGRGDPEARKANRRLARARRRAETQRQDQHLTCARCRHSFARPNASGRRPRYCPPCAAMKGR